MENTPHLLAGLRVVDLASWIAGPAAATVLGDFGADVVKVEPPGRRRRLPAASAQCRRTPGRWRQLHLAARQPQQAQHRADLKSPDARAVLERLVQWADVLVTNFPPPTRAKLGLDYENLASLNPRLIYADITGFGETGPDADKPGFDVTAYWARSGLMDMTRQGSAPGAQRLRGR